LTEAFDLTISADEWLAVAELVAMPLPGLDLEKIRSLPQSVRETSSAAGRRGLIARELVADAEDTGEVFRGTLLRLLQLLDRCTNALTVSISRDRHSRWGAWLWSDQTVVEQIPDELGSVIRFRAFDAKETASSVAAVVLAEVHSQDDTASSTRVKASLEDLESTLDERTTSLPTELSSALLHAGGLSRATRLSLSTSQVSEQSAGWIDGGPAGYWLIEPPESGERLLSLKDAFHLRRCTGDQLLNAIFPSNATG
jgi:hypothetical protein